MSKKSKHKPKGPKNPPQNVQQPPKQEVKEEQPAQLKVERVQEPTQPTQVEKPKVEPVQAEKPKIESAQIEKPAQEKVEEKPVQSESAPAKPKRNRNRKKKNTGSGVQDVEEIEETIMPEIVEEKKPDKPKVKVEEKENPEIADVKPEEKFEQPKSKKDKKKDKNLQKCEHVTISAETKSCVLPESEKKIEEVVKSEPVQSVMETDTSSTPVETKGGKNKKNKNKKGKDNKESQSDDASTPTDNISCEIIKQTKIEPEKSVEKIDDKSIESIVEKFIEKPVEKTDDKSVQKPITKPIEKSTAQVIEKSDEKIVEKPIETPVIEKEPITETIPENIPRNKKNKKEQSKQKQNKDANNQSKNDSQSCIIEAVPIKAEEKETKNEEVDKPETCPFKVEEKPKSEIKGNIPIPETADDIFPSLASSIEKTLEKLIVCETDMIASEQPKIEDDKKEKNKKKSKKDKDKSVDKIEDKNIIAESPNTQPGVTIIPSAIEIKTEVPSSEKIKLVSEEIQEKPISEEQKISEQDTTHLIVGEKRAPSKSPTRKDRRKKSPKPPKPEEKPQDIKQDDQVVVQQETQSCDIPKQEIICPIKKPEIQDDSKTCPIPEKTCENKKKKDKHHNKNTETAKDEKIAVSVPEDIINTLLSDTPPSFIKDSENVECDIEKLPEPISPIGAKNEKKPSESENTSPLSCPIKTTEKAEAMPSENVCPITKNLPVELPGKIAIDIEKEMKKALEVAIGVIVGDAPIDGNKNVITPKSATDDKIETENPSEEQKTCEKDNQNRQECKSKSKKNKNKHQHQQDSKVAEEKDEKSSAKIEIGSAPISEIASVVEQKNIECPLNKPSSDVAPTCPMKIPPISPPIPSTPVSSPPVITPSSTETAQLSISPVVTSSLEELAIATSPVNIEPPIVTPPIDSQTVPKEKDAGKKQEDNIQQEALKPPASPKPNKRTKDKKNKHGKGDDSKNTQAVSCQQSQQQQSSDQKASQSSEKSDNNKKQSEGEKNKDDKKQKDGDSQKSENKGTKDSQESTISAPIQETKPTGEQFEFLPIPDSYVKGNNTPVKSCDAKTGKDKNKKERKSPPKNQPKNLLGPSDIPAKSNKLDYKKEKNKDESIEELSQNAEIKLRNLDPRDVPEPHKKLKNTENSCFLPGQAGPSGKKSKMTITEIEDDLDEDEEKFVYKYSFRTVFIANACHICKATLKEDRFVCRFCHLVSYCSEKHRDDDWQIHQSLCYAICTISHAKGNSMT